MGEKGHKEDPRYFGGGGKDVWVEAASFQMEISVGFWFFLVKPRAAPAVPVLLWILCCFIALINKSWKNVTDTHTLPHSLGFIFITGGEVSDLPQFSLLEGGGAGVRKVSSQATGRQGEEELGKPDSESESS